MNNLEKRKQENWAKGKIGQDIAKTWYLDNGFKFIMQNYEYREGNFKFGEIDLIFEKMQDINTPYSNLSYQKLLVFVEVKLRNNNKFGYANQQITRSKLRFMQKTANYFLLKNPNFKNHFCRFDGAFIQNNKLEIIPNIF